MTHSDIAGPMLGARARRSAVAAKNGIASTFTATAGPDIEICGLPPPFAFAIEAEVTP